MFTILCYMPTYKRKFCIRFSSYYVQQVKLGNPTYMVFPSWLCVGSTIIFIFINLERIKVQGTIKVFFLGGGGNLKWEKSHVQSTSLTHQLLTNPTSLMAWFSTILKLNILYGLTSMSHPNVKGITPHPKANMKEFHLHVIVYHLTSRTSNLSNNSTFSHILELVCVCVCVFCIECHV